MSILTIRYLQLFRVERYCNPMWKQKGENSYFGNSVERCYSSMWKQKGFTLLEVLTAVVILAGLIAIIVQISYGTRRRVKKTAQLEKISLLLESKMLDLKGNFQGTDVIKLPEEAEGFFKEDPEYSWFYRTQALSLPSSELILPLIGLPESSLNSQMVDIFKSVLSDTIVEIKLTVFYQPSKGRKKTQMSLSSYFINYEQAPSFILNQINQLIPKGVNL